MKRCAVIGGGPGGLFSAYFLEKKLGSRCHVTLFESQPRIGGKIQTDTFKSLPVLYEAGVAELYDYSHIGPDPLRSLIATLGLTTIPMDGQAVVLGGQIVSSQADFKRLYGEISANEVDLYHQRCQRILSPEEYFEGYWQDDNASGLASQTFAEYLEQVKDERALRFITASVHSDLATEPHLTNALNGIKNSLMDDARYIRLYTIKGGIEKFPQALAENIAGDILTGLQVTRVSNTNDGRYQVFTSPTTSASLQAFDTVILALPDYWLRSVEFADSRLQTAVQRHCAFYDRPAHYLRVTVLFREPFWRDKIHGNYFMVDAFGGCCVYDESSRYEASGFGVLSWLLAGTDALVLSNFDEKTLVDKVLRSLPGAWQPKADLVIESRVYRWVAAINALPGGFPAKDMSARHQPEPFLHPNLFVAGDYLFDSTVNGALDSADFVTDLILAKLHKEDQAKDKVTVPSGGEPNRKDRLQKVGHSANETVSAVTHAVSSVLDSDYFTLYDGERSYTESFHEYFDAQYTADLIEAVWKKRPPYKLLDVGSASGLTLAEFEKLDIEAWGIENSREIHDQTEPRWRQRNRLGDVRQLEFGDDEFDFAYDTALCYVPEEDLERAIRELCRVTRTGLIFGSIVADMSKTVIEQHDVFYGAQSIKTLWEWSELFLSCGFRLAVTDRKTLDKTWQIETVANEGDCPWYQSSEAMRYCFYTKKRGSVRDPMIK